MSTDAGTARNAELDRELFALVDIHLAKLDGRRADVGRALLQHRGTLSQLALAQSVCVVQMFHLLHERL
jgi:hypothetical protein